MMIEMRDVDRLVQRVQREGEGPGRQEEGEVGWVGGGRAEGEG